MQLLGLVAMDTECGVGASSVWLVLAFFSGTVAVADAGVLVSESCDMRAQVRQIRLSKATSFHDIASNHGVTDHHTRVSLGKLIRSPGVALNRRHQR